ncbi:MAG: Chromosomal replication initiator protein DnaA [Firmicutes bacterium ADurb.Bin182]|nr:MAG: Chromosomal replication initiator protein DnaA [Firmicutes bacterium ADurb.Bin182]
MANAQAVWERSLDTLKQEMTQLSFNSWIKDIVPVVIRDEVLVLQAQSEFYCSTLNNLYLKSIVDAVNASNGTNYSIKIISPEERIHYIAPKPKKIEPGFFLNPRYTFETFVIGSSNNFAHAASLAVAKNPAKAYNPLFIYGGVGLGKTHLMHAIGHSILENNAHSNILYVTSETFLNELIESIRENKNALFRARYRNVDVLLVDDIQFIVGKESMQEEFFHTFNALHVAGKQIVISSDRPPKEIPTLEERLRSRFEWGLIVDIQPPDLETRIAILRKKAMIDNLDVSDSVLQYIAGKVQSNIRELEGSLTRVMAYAILEKRPVDINLADTALKDILPEFAPRKITPELIKEVVADYYSIAYSDMSSKRKDRNMAYPRQIAMYLCRTMTDIPLKQIGSLFGGRDHATVKYACDKIASDIESDRELAVSIDDMIKRIKND